MMIRGSALMLFIGGFMLWMMSQFMPILRLMMMDWVAWFMAIGGIVILMFVFGVSGTGMQYDTIPPGTAIINYIRRDGTIVPLLGRRIFSGESFLEVPKLGLIEDLGKDTVFLWGRKKVRFGLENVNYTPDPRHWNMTHALYNMGFDNSDDLTNVLNIPLIDSNAEKAKKAYYLERMANIYWNMTHEAPHGVRHLMDIFKKKRPTILFGKKRPEKKQAVPPVITKYDSEVKEADEWLKSRK